MCPGEETIPRPHPAQWRQTRAGLWFFNALNKTYTTNITFPLTFDYDDEQYIPVNPLPERVRINVTGMGWDLFRRSLGVKVPPLVLPLERPSEIKKIVGGTLPPLFSNQLEQFEINFILTDTLRLEIQPKITRWISLRLDSSTLDFKEGYARTSELNIEPDSIFIEGPMQIVNSFEEPVILELHQKNIDEDYSENVEVIFSENHLIKRNPPTVNINFTVDELVTIADWIALEIVNYPIKPERNAHCSAASAVPC